jgi:hypothetical protein
MGKAGLTVCHFHWGSGYELARHVHLGVRRIYRDARMSGHLAWSITVGRVAEDTYRRSEARDPLRSRP